MASSTLAYREFREAICSTLDEVLKILETKNQRNVENAEKLTKLKNQCFALSQDIDYDEVLVLNIGGTLVRMKRGPLNIFPSSRLSWMFNGNWDHILPRDDSDNFFLDLDPAWVSPIFGLLENFADNKQFDLDTFYDDCGNLDDDDDETVFSNRVNDETVGYYLCIEYFGLEKYFTIAKYFEHRIKMALQSHYINEVIDTSAEWQLERSLSSLTSQVPQWNRDKAYIFQKGHYFYGLVDWNRREENTKGLNHALLVNFSDNQVPLVEEAVIKSSDAYGISLQTKLQRKIDFLLPGRKSSYSQFKLMTLWIGRYESTQPLPCFPSTFSAELQIPMEDLTIGISSWVMRQERDLEVAFRITSTEINLFDEQNKFISQQMDDISQAKERLESKFSGFCQAPQTKTFFRRVKIACLGGGAELCIDPRNFKYFKDSMLAVKYASDVWKENASNEVDKYGCLIEHHNHECFKKLIDVMRMKAIVRYPCYKGKYGSYCPSPVRDSLKPAMSGMLKYLMIDESNFFGPLNK